MKNSLKRLLLVVLTLFIVISVKNIKSVEVLADTIEEVNFSNDGNKSPFQGEGYSWNDDTKTLTLDKAHITNLYLPDGYRLEKNEITIITNGDSKIGNIYFRSETGYFHAIKLIFKGSGKLTIDSYLNGTGDNNDNFIFDGANVVVNGSISCGGSGGADSYVTLKNSSKVKVNSNMGYGLYIQYLSVIENSLLDVESTEGAGIHFIPGAKITMDVTSEIKASGVTNGIIGELDYDRNSNSAFYSVDYFNTYYPEGAVIADSEYRTRFLDKNNQEMSEVTLKHRHNGEWISDGEDTHIKKCICGNEDREEHFWNDGEVIKDATTAEEGIKKYVCEKCGEIKFVNIDKLIEEPKEEESLEEPVEEEKNGDNREEDKEDKSKDKEETFKSDNVKTGDYNNIRVLVGCCVIAIIIGCFSKKRK